MRLWHQDLISVLPRQQLLGQHRECCALRGNGWAKKHATVQYVFDYSPYLLFQYHLLIMNEMKTRGYLPDALWEEAVYRGKICEPYQELKPVRINTPIYKEHNADYLQECIDNLKEKGILIEY